MLLGKRRFARLGFGGTTVWLSPPRLLDVHRYCGRAAGGGRPVRRRFSALAGSSMSLPRVLVTGAEGYVGRRLAAFLAAHDLDVHGWDAGFFAGPDLFTAERSAVHWRRWDIRDVNVAELRGFDAIVHLAELS